jgi:hypothetical protein
LERNKKISPASTKVFEEAINAIKFLVLPKKFGPSQKFLGLVKGQGIQWQHLKLIKLLEK